MGPNKEGGGEVEYVGWRLSGEKREGGIGVGVPPKGGPSFPAEDEPRGKWARAGSRALGPLAGPVL